MGASSFRNPDKTCRPAPFWSWNGRMLPAELRRQIRLMWEQGMGGFFMHSRVGLETPYMGEEWMAAVAASIESARTLDMEAWFYDEDKWPSGFAGGMVPALGDEYRIKGLESRMFDAAGLAEAWANPGPGVAGDSLRVAFRLRLENGKLLDFDRLSEPPTEQAKGVYMLCQVRTAQTGQERYNGESYVDLMNPKVTEAFIQLTHEKYRQRFGDLFDPNAPGIFTDEPNVSPIAGYIQTSWTPALPARFRELWGYDLVDRLPLLLLAGKGSRQVRHNYWATITTLFRDNFTRPFSEWCERNGIMMTGHYLGEDSLYGQTLRVGAVMPNYPYAHLPGIDHLGRDIRNPLTLKQVSSVAHQMGRKRVLCEIFGKAGHSMSFAEQKWISDFHFALGINFLNQHLTLYSMLGERKRDFPANISWAQPYWQDYRIFNDYAARCSWFLQRGDFQADILLLHPIHTFWSLLPGRSEESHIPGYDEQVKEARQLNTRFLSVFDALLADHRDFDLGDEMVMADHATVDGAELQVGGMRYRTVVLPYCAILQPSTLDLLRAFSQNGGTIYLVGDSSLTESLVNVEVVSDARALVAGLGEAMARQVSVTTQTGDQATDVLYHHRVAGERQLYFLANTDLDTGITVQVKVAAIGDVTVFDPTTGEVALVGEGRSSPSAWSAAKVLKKEADGVLLQWQAAPAGSLMFSVGRGLDAAGVDDTAGSAAPSMESGETREGYSVGAEVSPSTQNGPWRFSRLQPNVMTLDFCRASVAGGPMSAEFRPIAAVRDEVLALCGRHMHIQPYRYQTGQMPSRPVAVQLEFGFQVEALPETLALVVEQPGKMRIAVNGEPVTKKAVNDAGTDLGLAWLGDPGFGALDIRSLARIGENNITLSFTAAADEADVEEIYLLGDFAVWNRNGIYVVGEEPGTLRPGSWVDQGYPFYVGTMRYRLDVDGKYRRLDLTDAAASLLRVSVDGGGFQALPWQPWIADLGEGSHSGTKTVEIDVVSSLRNTFGPLHHNQGDLGSVTPFDFHVDPAFWTDGYQFAPYGLLGPVRLQ